MLAGAGWEVWSGRRSTAEALRFWAVAGYVALLVLAFRVYYLETRTFYEFIALLTLFGFIINHYLPASLRRPFFLLLSVVGIVGVFGFVSAPAALGLVVGGLVLVGVCHLPIPMWARIAILVACAGGLATVRLGWVYAGWAAVILPILASMFMFRLPVYLYDITNDKGPKDLWGRLSYFFMFPNLVFPFFPVVDYATFGRTYYNDDAIKIYERGATFMLRGLVHLLIYRAVHTYFVLGAEEVNGPGTFLQYIVSNFALYFRISGMFHLIAGLLLLFGFNLHETHSQFLFSNSFIDIWRRINIYWKDFMQKMFFNPSYLRFKRLGASHLTSVALAMGVVFVVSWALHAYQWFWLSGTTLFTLPDMLFWGILAVFMVAQTFYEARPRKQSPPNTGARAIAVSRAFLVVRIACTFLSLCLLWSFWTSPTVSAWLDLLARSELVPALTEPGAASAAQWIATLAFMALVIVMVAITAGVSFGLAPAAASQTRKRPPAASGTPAFLGSVGLSSALVCGILALQVPAINSAFGSGVQRIASDISVQKLNGADEVMMERGYYEGLTTDNRFNPELWDFFSTRSRITSNDAGSTVPGMRLRDDYLGRDYVPNSVFTISGVGTPINRWGFPDQDYTLEKPPGTYRIALIEASRALGAGVEVCGSVRDAARAASEQRDSRQPIQTVRNPELLSRRLYADGTSAFLRGKRVAVST